METHYRLERENDALSECLWAAYEHIKSLDKLREDNERLESELRAARLKLERIGALAR